MPVVITSPAFGDLRAIQSYIGDESPRAASRIAIALLAACDSLEHLPECGRPGRKSGTRELTIIWPYVVVYRVKDDLVEILRIWHGAQDR